MNLLLVMAGMLSADSVIKTGRRVIKYFTTYVHKTKSGPGRSVGVKRSSLASGVKLSRKAFEGNLGMRGRSLIGASLMAQQGNLGFDSKGRRKSSGCFKK